MKSIRIKALISLLILSISLCASNLREETKTYSQNEVDEAYKNYAQVAVTATEGGSWDKGYDCPELFIEANGIKPELPHGPVHIEGAKLMNNDGYNSIGWTIVFKNPPPPKNWINSICNPESDGKTYVIPWRYIVSFNYHNPYLGNKLLRGEVRNDKHDTFFFKLKLPHKMIGWYINDEEGNRIITKINSKAIEVRDFIKKEKEHVLKNYQDYKQLFLDQFRMKQGSDKIKKQIENNNAIVQENEKKANLSLEKISKIKKEYQVFLSEYMAHQMQIHQLESDLIRNNIQIKTLSETVTKLQNSKTNPQNEQQKAEAEKAELTNKSNVHFDNLLRIVPGKETIINKARALFLASDSTFKNELDKYIPRT